MHHTVFIGRFQPFHTGHHEVVKKALEVSDNLFIVIGSHNGARTVRNPFSLKERTAIIRAALTEEQNDRVIITSVCDHLYNLNRWILDVQNALDCYADAGDRISLIGHNKDSSSFYLKMFPQWNSIAVPDVSGLSATTIREMLYEDPINVPGNLGSPYVSCRSHDLAIKQACETEYFDDIVLERRFLAEYWNEWGHDGQFNTVDAVVTIGGHILVIERGGHPGRGQIALPGGFLNRNETIEDAMLRELSEETGLKVPVPVLRGSIKSRWTYDDVDRDPRGRIITHAFHVDMKNYSGGDRPGEIKLPKIQAGDDARAAHWMKLSDFANSREHIFGDHYDIVEHLVGILS